MGEAADETGDVEQWTPIGSTTLLAGQITDIASKAAVVQYRGPNAGFKASAALRSAGSVACVGDENRGRQAHAIC